MRALLAEQPIALDPQHIDEAAEYLVWELSAERPEFTFSKYARQLQEGLKLRLQGARLWDDYRQTLGVSASGPPPSGNWPATGCADYVATPSSSRWRPT